MWGIKYTWLNTGPYGLGIIVSVVQLAYTYDELCVCCPQVWKAGGGQEEQQ